MYYMKKQPHQESYFVVAIRNAQDKKESSLDMHFVPVWWGMRHGNIEV